MKAEWNMFICLFIHSKKLFACLLFAQLDAWGC